MKVQNMTSNKTNREIPNQFIITDEENNCIYFQSYQSIIVKKSIGHTFLDENYYNYSKTTSKYRNQFLNETTKEIENKIKQGIYILTNLN